ncbi:hypothetical protein CHLNCDRAFT_140462 [Chlorella variabilis]|uniref:F-box domain-containing protein n=1 Tax=Chlorella variabilis TaxID=554065 RepID=E1Z5F7_CHLVA|nr:hypothetical protein CHLNCDRAFT_140462 [Chlorella variabilis]EFN58753.1 hypothetical protein CHLNCDRAFT_140462 [Chlorella variabilis]|eukprot:XP_005850855.1 hypothetical protein CHLNCDRAFT_140462 [Chlorella variabilis]
MPTPGTTTIDALPDALLGRVMALARDDTGDDMRLTCKRWNRAFNAEPAMWRGLHICVAKMLKLRMQPERHEWLAAQRLLRHVGGMVVELSLEYDSQDPADPASLADVMQLCRQLSQLAVLDVAWRQQPLPEVVAQLLPCLTALTQLQLTSMGLPVYAADALSRLVQLCNLSCHADGGTVEDSLPSPIIEAMAHLTALSSLGLRCTLLPAAIGGALRQMQLCSLHLAADGIHRDFFDDHALAHLTRLTTLQLLCATLPPATAGILSQLRLSSLDLAANSLADVFGSILLVSSLTLLEMTSWQQRLPPDISRLTRLRGLRELHLFEGEPLPDADVNLIDALVSPCTPLEELELRGSKIDWQDSTRLSGLLALEIDGKSSITMADMELSALQVVEASGGAHHHGTQLISLSDSKLPALQKLVVHSYSQVRFAHVEVPALCAIQLYACARIEVMGVELPALRMLHLRNSWSSMQQLLQHVAQQAPQLSDLEIVSFGRKLAADPEMSLAWLAGMRCLSKLTVKVAVPVELPSGPYLSGLKEHLGAAGFTRLPPALTAATHLHSLGFSDTASSMRITRDDVNSILAHMGQLRQLRCTNVETWGALMKPPVLLHLFSSMPQLIVPEDWD